MSAPPVPPHPPASYVAQDQPPPLPPPPPFSYSHPSPPPPSSTPLPAPRPHRLDPNLPANVRRVLKVSSRCVADYPIFYITCTNRWQGRWTTKPPLFSNRPTTTHTAHSPLPSNTRNSTSQLPIALQSSRPKTRTRGASGTIIHPLRSRFLHLHDPRSIHTHTNHPTNRSSRHPRSTTERPSPLSTTTIPHSSPRCTPEPTRFSHRTPLHRHPRHPAKMGHPPSPHPSPPSSHSRRPSRPSNSPTTTQV
jgi:hypothetical protein